MRVHVLSTLSYDGDVVRGVYSDEERAAAAVRVLRERFGDRYELSVEAFEIDAEPEREIEP